MPQQSGFVYEAPGQELEWRAVSAPSMLLLVALMRVALRLTRRHRATIGAFGTTLAGLGCVKLSLKMRPAVGESSREAGACPDRCTQRWRGQSGTAGRRIAMLSGQ